MLWCVKSASAYLASNSKQKPIHKHEVEYLPGTTKISMCPTFNFFLVYSVLKDIQPKYVIFQVS